MKMGVKPAETTRSPNALEVGLLEATVQRQNEALRESARQITQLTLERDAARKQVARLREDLANAGAEIQRLTAALADSQTLCADAEARFMDALKKLDSARRVNNVLRRGITR